MSYSSNKGNGIAIHSHADLYDPFSDRSLFDFDFPMDLAVNVTISDENDTMFQKTITVQEMRESGFQQERLNTDTDRLPKLKEGDLLYLAAAVNVGYTNWM